MKQTAFDSHLSLTHYRISSHKIRNHTRLALITDLHGCFYGERQRELLDLVEEEQPQAIFLGGDIFDHVIPHDNSYLTLEYLSKRYSCFYVSGNHEYKSGEIMGLKRAIRNYGVTVLEGDCTELHVGGQTLQICGVDDPLHLGKRETMAQLERAFLAVDSGLYTVLLTHRPELIREYTAYDFDLILAGHAHGGQWRIPGVLNGLYAPHQGLFPPYAGGLYQVGTVTMVVSRGLARETTRVPRIWNPPELVVIDLESQKERS